MPNEIKREDLTTEDIVSAMMEPPQKPALDVNDIEMLKQAGLRDISELDDGDTMTEIAKSVQITQVLEDYNSSKTPKKSIKEYLDQHLKFLLSVSPGKDLGFIVNNMTVEHAQAILKTSAKMNNVPEAVIKKHLKTLRKKYS
jgi:hypothetical protein